jgi:hypothetical protein
MPKIKMAKRTHKEMRLNGELDDLDTLGLRPNFFQRAVWATTPAEQALVDCDYAMYIHEYIDPSRGRLAWHASQNKLKDLTIKFNSLVRCDDAQWADAVTSFCFKLKQDHRTFRTFADLHHYVDKARVTTQVTTRAMAAFERGTRQFVLPDVFLETRENFHLRERILELQEAHNRTFEAMTTYRVSHAWMWARLDFEKPLYPYKREFWIHLDLEGSCRFNLCALHIDDRLRHKFVKLKLIF